METHIVEQPELIAARIQIERLDKQIKAMGQENDLLQQENARLRARQLEAAILAAFEAEGRAAVAAALEGLWRLIRFGVDK